MNHQELNPPTPTLMTSTLPLDHQVQSEHVRDQLKFNRLAFNHGNAQFSRTRTGNTSPWIWNLSKFEIYLNMTKGYYRWFFGQNVKILLYLLMMLKWKKIVYHTISMSYMNEFLESVEICTWYSKQSTMLFTDNLCNSTVTKLHITHIYSGR